MASESDLLGKVKLWSLRQGLSNGELLHNIIQLLQSEETNCEIQALEIMCYDGLVNVTPDYLKEFLDIVSSTMLTVFEQQQNEVIKNIQCSSNITCCCLNNTKSMHKIGAHLLTFLCSETREFSGISVFIEVLLKLIEKTYKFCLQVESKYDSCFKEVQLAFNALIVECRSLQKSLLQFIQSLETPLSLECDINSICNVCGILFSICLALEKIDTKETFQFLKTYVVFASNYSLLIRDRLDIATVINHICQDFLQEMQLTDQLDKVSFQKSLKVCHFKLKLIIVLCEKFKGFLGDCISKVSDLLFYLYEKIAVYNLKVASDHQKLIEDIILPGVEPLLLHLMEEREFYEHATNPNCENHLAQFLLLLSVLDSVSGQSDLLDSWIVKNNFFKLLFSSFNKCKIEQYLPAYFPGVVYPGKLQGKISLYRYACSHICAFLACLPQKYFAIFEMEMLKALLISNSVEACLVIDVWCFIGRYTSSQLCFDHCKILSKVLLKHPDLTQVEILIHRLFSFLSSKHQLEFIEQFPIESNIRLWTLLPATKATRARLSIQSTNLVQTIQNCYQSQPKNVLYIANVLVIHGGENIIFQFFERIFTGTKIDITAVETTESVIVLFSRILDQLQTSSNYNEKFLSRVISQIENLNTQYGQLSIINILQHLAKVSLSNSLKSKIPKLFLSVLQSQNYVIKGLALDAFTNFAHMTPHKELIPNISNAQLIPDISNYLNNIPHGGQLTVCDVKDILAGMCSAMESSRMYENVNKRPKIENIESPVNSFVNQNAIKALNNLAKAVDGMEVANKEMKLTLKNVQSLKSLITRLNELC